MADTQGIIHQFWWLLWQIKLKLAWLCLKVLMLIDGENIYVFLTGLVSLLECCCTKINFIQLISGVFFSTLTEHWNGLLRNFAIICVFELIWKWIFIFQTLCLSKTVHSLWLLSKMIRSFRSYFKINNLELSVHLF